MRAWTIAIAMVGAFAGDEVGAQPMTYGYGQMSCGAFVAASEATRAGEQQSIMPYIEWFAEYTTMASGASGIHYFKGTDLKGRQFWLENYCRAHPLAPFQEAAGNLLVELNKKQKH